jgi:hypothetical protein
MKTLIKTIAVCAILGAAVNLDAQTVTVDPTASWIGYMNVFNLPSAGGGYQFGSSWGPSDLTATFSGPTLSLGPNCINDPSSYWYTPSGGPGSTGNKIMDANMYVESTGLYVGTTLTFTGDVLANTLLSSVDPNGNGWTGVAFIKDFASDYSSFNTITAPLLNGVFSISLATVNDAARHVQYGFETVGPDVWITDIGPYGNIQITAVPEPSTIALAGLGGFAALSLLRRRNK